MLAEIYQHQESLHSCEPHEYFLHLLQFVNASMALLLACTHGVVVRCGGGVVAEYHLFESVSRETSSSLSWDPINFELEIRHPLENMTTAKFSEEKSAS